jgi:glycosyltransferase involved in cell wall biosynthesis
MKRRILKLCSATLAGGIPHADYLRKLGVPSDRTFLGYDAVDNDYFAQGAKEVRGQPGEVEPGLHGPREAGSREKYGLPERYFLASARFIEKKNLPRLLQAYARYRTLAGSGESRERGAESGERKSVVRVKPQGGNAASGGPVVRSPLVPWSLVLLGDGPLRPSILNLRSSLGLDTCVHLPGFIQYPDLPIYYGLASAFIHASTTEQWGLVVNEAMASGLPVLVSNRCGCVQDLVKEGVNGFTFDPYNVEELAQLMVRAWSTEPRAWSKMGDASREIISNWGPERFASGLQQAVECALRIGPVKPTLLQKLILKGMLVR